MKSKLFAAAALGCVASIVSAQAPQPATSSTVPAPAPAPIVATVALPAPVAQASLPANTEILLRMNDELTTRGGKVEVGHSFRLSVVDDVRIGNFVVIPRGTPATGEVTWKTGKGAFGKSGKMEIDLRHLDLNGQRIPLSGHYRQEGEGNTVATVAAVVAVGVFGAFVTGKSATIPQGRELKAYTTEVLPVTLPAVAPAPMPATPVVAPIAASAPAASSN
jgi:hypothetical protein